jgi:Bifunctional DNA primase/polymerase, N-terminal
MREIHARKRRSSGALLSAAFEYAQRWHWQLLPGVGYDQEGRLPVCRCPREACPIPGGHPFDPPLLAATTDTRMIQWWWRVNPGVPIVLPTGRNFSALEVSARAGKLAQSYLAALGIHVGPVAATPKRAFFFVQPYRFDELAFLLDRFGCGPTDVRCYGQGGYVIAPPSRLPEGVVRWRVRPDETDGKLPTCAELLSSLAGACHRTTSAARTPPH